VSCEKFFRSDYVVVLTAESKVPAIFPTVVARHSSGEKRILSRQAFLLSVFRSFVHF